MMHRRCPSAERRETNTAIRSDAATNLCQHSGGRTNSGATFTGRWRKPWSTSACACYLN